MQRADDTSLAAEPAQSELSFFALDEPVEIVDMEENANFQIILGFDVLKLFSFHYEAGRKKFTLVIQP